MNEQTMPLVAYLVHDLLPDEKLLLQASTWSESGVSAYDDLQRGIVSFTTEFGFRPTTIHITTVALDMLVFDCYRNCPLGFLPEPPTTIFGLSVWILAERQPWR